MYVNLQILEGGNYMKTKKFNTLKALKELEKSYRLKNCCQGIKLVELPCSQFPFAMTR